MRFFGAFIISILILYASFSYAMEVAITVDDLPYNGDIPPNTTRLDIAKKMLSVFEKHHIKGLYGFVNAK